MKKLSMIVLALVPAFAVAAETNDQELVKFGNKMVTREYRRNAVRRAMLSMNGGHVRRENSASGWFIAINAQSRVPQAEIEKAVATIDRQVHVQTKVIAGSGVTVGNIRDKMNAAGAKLCVAIVDGGETPALLDASEEGWAIVNVARLAADNPETSVLAARVRREVLRSFPLIAGGICATQDSLMRPIVKPQDLDLISREEYAVMLLNIYPIVLPNYGVTPWYERTYKRACEEGWAPAPTNKYQKAIWDKIHAAPTDPIVIKPETKKQ